MIQSQALQLLGSNTKNLPRRKLSAFKRATISESERNLAESQSTTPKKFGNQMDKSKKKWNWHTLYSGTILFARLIRFYKTVTRETCSLVSQVPNFGGVLSFQLNTFKQLKDSKFIDKIDALLKDRQVEGNIASIERLLYFRCKSFSQYSTAQRIQFCRVMELLTFPKV